MKKIYIFLLLLFAFNFHAKAQDAKSPAGSPQIIAVGKNSPGKADNGGAVSVSATAMPVEEKDKFIHSNAPYHQAISTGVEKQNTIVEINAPVQKANNQNNVDKRAVISGQTATKAEVPSKEVSQKAVKVK